MKVTLINISDSGGGAAAAGYRLYTALRANGVSARMVVQRRAHDDEHIAPVVRGAVDALAAKVNFFAERLPFILNERDPSVRFNFSTANAGTSIADHRFIHDADILHVHWTNSGFLSLRDLAELLRLGKPVVWTLHDMWAFTGGCHYSEGCRRFTATCGECPMLKRPRPNDLSRKGWLAKRDLYRHAKKLVLVGCSNWMKETALQSSLLRDFRVEAVPNPIDTDLYRPTDRLAARRRWGLPEDGQVILFGAANVLHTRKGVAYLTAALQKLKEKHSGATAIRVVIFGKNRGFDPSGIPFEVTTLPLIRSHDDLVALYNAADLFVQPSLEDNLPNMVMEALACGTPVAAFATGGLPDLVEHRRNGYLATSRSADDLAEGMRWLLESAPAGIAGYAREKVLREFNGATVANAYLKIYRELLA